MKSLSAFLAAVFVLILMLISPFFTFSQEIPSIPYQLSQAVQARARDLNLWTEFVKEPSDAIRYFDALTAADLIATARFRARGKAVGVRDDYDVGFAALCVFVPNKPQTEILRSISSAVRLSISGIYLSQGKRNAFIKALQPILVRGTKAEVFSALAGATLATFEGQFIRLSAVKDQPR